MKRYIHTADAVFALILFCAFAISMLMVLTTGAQSYQNVRSSVENRYSEETGVSYIVMKLRHYDDTDCTVEIGDVDGIPALCMTETYDGTDYVTSIYFYNGYVMELYTEAGYGFLPEDGFQIVEAQGLDFSIEDGLCTVTCVGTGDGRAQATVSLRDGGAR